MPKGRKAELRDEVEGFAILSHPVRVGILSLLAEGPKNATTLRKAVGLTQPAFSYHLGLLRMGRLVNGVRQGKSVVYATDKANVKALVSALGKLTPR